MIDVNIAESRIANSKLVPIQNNIGNAVGCLSQLLSSIDPRILEQNNLHTRIDDSRNTAAAIEIELRNLRDGITSMLNRYEETDQNFVSKVPNLGNRDAFGK